MLRRSTLAIAVAVALAPAAGYGLSLGEIRSSSLMNDRFEGDIELTDVAAGEILTIKARLAPIEIFRKAGVDYAGAVKRLRFKPYLQANGRPAIRVTSPEAVRDPFLNFLVEVEWPQGRTVKEFTVLLDPPTFTERRAPRVETPVAAPRESARPAEAASPAAAARPLAPATPAPAPLRAEGTAYGPVRQGETLWRIAERSRAAGVTAEQTMIAILQANPDAFVGGNINRLKAGARLRLPTAQQAGGLDPLQARDDYLRQMGRHVPERRAVRAPAPMPAATPEPPPGDLVRLVTPAAEAAAPKNAVTESVQPTAAADLRQDVLLAHEKAESARQTADLLQGRVADLETQLHDLQRLLVLRDTQLAQLQQKAVEAAKAPPPAPLTTEAPPAASPATAAEPKPEAPVLPVAVAQPTPTEIAPPVQAMPAEAVVAPPPPAAEPKAVPLPRPAEPAAMPAHPKEFAALLNDPANVFGAGIAGLGVLGALLWAIVGRRRSAAAQAAVAQAEEGASLSAPLRPGPASVLAPAVAVPEAALAPATIAAAAAGASAVGKSEEVERVATEDLAALQVSTTDLFGLKGETTEVDPTEEADVYIAYGRYEQAEQLLRLALEMEPGRLALQHKLLEVYAASRDAPAFAALFAQLQAAAKPAEDPAAWQQALRMGRQLDPANPLYVGGVTIETPGRDDDLSRMQQDLAADLDRLSAKGDDFGELTLKAPATDSGLEQIDAGSVLNDLSLDLGTEDSATTKSSHPFNLDVAEELKGAATGVGPLGEIDLGEALAWDLDKTDAAGLVAGEIPPAEVTAEQLDDAAREVPDFADLEIGPDTALELGGETTLVHADTTLELVDDVETKLDLARAYVELGDQDSARLMLEEAIQEGNPAQKAAAEALLKELG